jgi:predicted Zn-dependent protease with MMP-like domain
MVEVSDQEFQRLIDEALGKLPGDHAKNIQNVAILYQDEPTQEQRQQLALRNGQSLLGLYEGLPLSERQGMTRLLPDRITLFRKPLQGQSATLEELGENIRHTLWHEIAHYYGLNHDRIHELE